MDNNIFNEIGTTLDLNGPILSLSEQPTGATGIGTTAGATGGGSVSFTGIATGVEEGTGYLSYQWYEQDVGKLSDSTYVTGTASTGPAGTASTLTISNLITPTDNQRKFYLVTDYVASAYGTGKSTGNAWNEPLTSGIATATVSPLIEIVAQPPEGRESLIDQDATIHVNADLTDSYFADDLIYQWYLNGELAEDGVKTVTTTTSAATAGSVEETYTSKSSHTFPSIQIDNLEVTVAAAAGGHGGNDGGGPGGNQVGGRVARFSFPGSDWLGKTLYAYVGLKGNGGGSSSGGRARGGTVDGIAAEGSGGFGGRSGYRGWSGEGGGGGACSAVSDLNENNHNNTGIVVAGGGGGGGGGSHNRSGTYAQPQPTFGTLTTSVPIEGHPSGAAPGPGQNPARNGLNCPSDGGGGGGGGGGTRAFSDHAGDGGSHGFDNSSGGKGGYAGGSGYDTTKATLLNQWVGPTSANGYVNIKYTGYTDTSVTTVTNTTLSGTTSNTLTIKCDSVGIQTCQCKITSATASNSPIWTDVTNFVTSTTVDQNTVEIENIGINNTATISSVDLSNGDHEFITSQSDVSAGEITKYYSIYSPDKDIDVEMDLYGGKGDDKGSYTGGEGGYSRIRFTMAKNQEYVIAGLSTDSVNTPFLYRKSNLMACVGQGGDAGSAGDGGDGGGVDVNGGDGGGRGFGGGGYLILSGTLGGNGEFGSAFQAPEVYPGDVQRDWVLRGQTIKCTKGVYWAQQGYGACQGLYYVKFRLPDGTIVDNTTASIERGFKAGYNIMETAGKVVSGGDGNGGNGATGGDGASEPGTAGGGGGSGYQDGTVTVVDTQQGGSTGNAKVILRVVT